jgi:hypothetical protein
MRREFPTLLAALALFAGAAMPAAAAPADADTQNFVIPFATTLTPTCGGEAIHLEGDLHVVQHTTFSSAGQTLVLSSFNPAGIAGIGMETGAQYRATGDTQQVRTDGRTTTYINNFRLIGAGQAGEFLVHYTVHQTVDPSGQITATVDNRSIECR